MDININLLEDINKLCRSCLKVVGDNKQCFGYALIADEKLTEISAIYESVSSLKVNVGDGLPTTMCFSCYKLLVQAHIYKNRCRDAEKKLKEFLQKGNSEKANLTECTKEKNSSIISDIFIPEVQGDNNMYSRNEQSEIIEIPDDEEIIQPEFLDINNLRSIDNKLITNDSNSEITQFSKLCSLCGKLFFDACALSLHFVTHSLISVSDTDIKSKFLFCELCGQLFDSNLTLDEHYNGEHSDKSSWNCSKCNSIFDREVELLQHNLSHFPSTKDTMVSEIFCSLCDLKFSSKEELLNHTLTHLVLRYKCRLCEMSFCTQESYSSHRKLKHNGKYVCHICDKILHTEIYLKNHIRQVHVNVQRIYNCEICNKSFKTTSTLKLHVKTHSKIKDFICSYCGYSTHHKADLHSHIRIHTKERPFKCNFVNCKWGFATSSQLNVHMKFHLNVREHKCSICSSSFVTSYCLKKHMEQHKNQRLRYSCPVCHKTLAKPYNLKMHLKRHESC